MGQGVLEAEERGWSSPEGWPSEWARKRNVTARWYEDLEEVMKLNYVKTVSVGCMIFSSHVQLRGTVQRWIAGFANGVLQSRGHAP